MTRTADNQGGGSKPSQRMPLVPAVDTGTALAKNVGGRPRKVMPADAEKRAEKLASEGSSLRGIATAFGVGKDVFNRWIEERPELLEAINRGQESERHVLHSNLVTAAKKGNIVAAIFLLKSRHGYRESEQTDNANRVSITFSLPGAMKPEQFTIENDTSPKTQ